MDTKRKRPPDGAANTQTQKGNEPCVQCNTVPGDLNTMVQEMLDIFASRMAEADALGDLTVTDQVLVLEGLVAYAAQLPTIRKLTLYRVIEKQVGFGPDVLKKCEEEFVKAIEMWNFLSEGEGVSNDYH
jgi:hypothetical protein